MARKENQNQRAMIKWSQRLMRESWDFFINEASFSCRIQVCENKGKRKMTHQQYKITTNLLHGLGGGDLTSLYNLSLAPTRLSASPHPLALVLAKKQHVFSESIRFYFIMLSL